MFDPRLINMFTLPATIIEVDNPLVFGTSFSFRVHFRDCFGACAKAMFVALGLSVHTCNSQ